MSGWQKPNVGSGEDLVPSLSTEQEDITPAGETSAREEIDAHDPPAVIRAKGDDAVAMILRASDDPDAITDKSNISWWHHEVDQRLAKMGAHAKHEHWSLYTHKDPAGTVDNNDVWKRLDVFGGADQTEARWQNLSAVRNMAQDGTNTIYALRQGHSAGRTGFHYEAPDGTTDFRIEHLDQDSGGHLKVASGGQNYLYFLKGGGMRLFTEFDNYQNVSTNVVWESDTTANRPSSPVVGQRFFDTDLGQPIWYDGSAWVDATGTSV
ncbi:hypothetical protein E6P09_14255 [Haloferax mediterranei ATCC 33500]|nr:hypothetical protein [Haloferax mediterranei]ELZ99737.1 hypothetical protein C439_14324 [Haloferax mediterranei ATCC 33500]MDX5987061.1 hypothetical protein [Haloferax mediterranei ATCC 33500]QCQ76377.1 hypothetical protein E6P09_14255 [Haloferax mediterranei ATCC 33500]